MTRRLCADRIRERAAEHGAASIPAMAKLFGCSRQHMDKLLKGEHLPSLELAHQIADVLGMPVEDLTEPV